MRHRLDPLLRPKSVAIVGASAREHTVGNYVLDNIVTGGYAGAVYPVNPGYDALFDLPCYASLARLPETPELAIFCVSDERIEQALDEAIAAGVSAVSIMSSLYIDNDTEPLLRARVERKLATAGIIACGANGMGFYTMPENLWACGFDSRTHPQNGNVSLISHSGSGMCGIVDCEERIRFNLVVSTGNELAVTMDEYLDFALDLPDTKVVGLFVETARNPEGLRAALEKANRKRIPIVAIKVGKTKRSAELAVSHSGAIAGDDATYAALFDRYGVQRVDDMEELAHALILFSTTFPIGPGGLVALHDSGGERQLLIDLATAADVPLPEVSAETAAKLRAVLDPELPPVNPLDGWSRGGPNADQQMTDCITYLMEDPQAALGVLMLDRAPHGAIYESYVDYMKAARATTEKPIALVAAWQGSGSDPLAITTTHAGMPVLDGVSPFLTGVRAMMAYRDFLDQPTPTPCAAPADAVAKWRQQLKQEAMLSEADAMQMLADFGIDASPCRVVRTEETLLNAVADIRWPLVLKTAAKIAHKSDVGGVHLNLTDEPALLAAFRDLQTRLGDDVLVAPQANAGIEMILGARQDPQFGPIVIVGFGGVHAELLRDVAFALPPFDAAYARKLLSKLRMRKLLDGVRGAEAADIDRLCQTASRFSAMVYAMRDDIREIDVNPIIASSSGSRAVDAFVVSNKKRNRT